MFFLNTIWYSKKTHKIIKYKDDYWYKKEGQFHKQEIKDYIDKLSKNEWISFNDLYNHVNGIRKISYVVI